MAYADETFYRDTFGGTVIPDTDLPGALARAARTIDQATRERIEDLSLWPEAQQTRIKNANCAEAEFLYQYGDLLDVGKLTGGYSIGDVSVSAASDSSDFVGSSGLCIEAEGFLYRTGLLYRGV